MDLRNMLPTRRFFMPTIIVLLLLILSGFVPREYKTYILGAILPFILVKLVLNLIKIKKEDKVNKTTNLLFAIFDIIVTIAIMLALYFGTRK